QLEIGERVAILGHARRRRHRAGRFLVAFAFLFRPLEDLELHLDAAAQLADELRVLVLLLAVLFFLLGIGRVGVLLFQLLALLFELLFRLVVVALFGCGRLRRFGLFFRLFRLLRLLCFGRRA